MLETFQANQWNENFSAATAQQAINSLENGHILFFPELTFSLTPEEKYFLSPDHADPQAKNISYHAKEQKLWGVQRLTDGERLQLTSMLDRFSRYATQFIKTCYRFTVNISRLRVPASGLCKLADAKHRRAKMISVYTLMHFPPHRIKDNVFYVFLLISIRMVKIEFGVWVNPLKESLIVFYQAFKNRLLENQHSCVSCASPKVIARFTIITCLRCMTK